MLLNSLNFFMVKTFFSHLFTFNFVEDFAFHENLFTKKTVNQKIIPIFD
jgi:hypothetical protein